MIFLESRPIFLIGFMASGKSTLGEALAHRLGWTFIDLDKAIEEVSSSTVAQIFATYGEEEFRRLETKVLHTLSTGKKSIIACGGGTPLRKENIDFMLERGVVVRLDASPEVIVRRLLLAPSNQRPLVEKYRQQPELLYKYVVETLRQRQSAYAKAHLSVDANTLENEEQIQSTVDDTITLLSTYL